MQSDLLDFFTFPFFNFRSLMPLACVKNWERIMFDEMELNLSFKKKQNTVGEGGNRSLC